MGAGGGGTHEGGIMGYISKKRFIVWTKIVIIKDIPAYSICILLLKHN